MRKSEKACENVDVQVIAEAEPKPCKEGADWLRARLKERGWDAEEFQSNGEPDPKTVLKIYRGMEDVVIGTLNKIARTLSQKGQRIETYMIPLCRPK